MSGVHSAHEAEVSRNLPWIHDGKPELNEEMSKVVWIRKMPNLGITLWF